MSEMQNVIWPGWEIVRRIGSGSFGTVYEIQRDVYGDIEKAALKVIKLPRSEDEVDYLRCTGLDDASITINFHQQVGSIAREYKLMSQMRNNPNVVRCDDFQDVQHEDGLGWDIYIKMELLSPLIKNLDKVATEQQIIQLGKDICNALISCQEKNIIHRDIKPQNVFISDAGVFKLGDFGIARTIEHTTHATASIGTYSYMAPEVEKNQPYGRTADIYSLGLMMYWLLNERRGAFMPLPPAVPCYGDEEAARGRRFSGEPIPAPKHGSDMLKSVVLKACAFDPADRYQSAQEMWDALCALDGTEHTPGTAFVPALERHMHDVYEEEMTVGPGGAASRRSDVASATDVEPIDEPGIDYVNDNTVGPAFKTVAEKTSSAAEKKTEPVKAEEPELKKEKKLEPEKAEKTKPEKTTPQKIEQAKSKKSGHKAPMRYLILGVAAAIVLLALLLIVPSCNSEHSEPTLNLPPVDTTATTPTGITTEATEGTSTEPSETASHQLDWSEWTDELPANVTEESFDIEEKTLYSSRVLEVTSSSDKTMDGWELYDTVESGEGYGDWIDSKDKKPDQKSGREISTYTVYRYRTKETTTSNSASLSGWTQYGSSTSSWSSWSGWSTASVAESANREVETRTEYRYRTTSGSGGYSDWSDWSQWQDAYVSANDLRDVQTRTVETNSYFYYQCNSCGVRWYSNKAPCTGCGGSSFTYRTGSGDLIMDPTPFLDSGYYQSNDGTGMVFLTSLNGTSKTQYRYRTRTQLPGSTGEWSSWGTTPYTSTSTREVQSRTVYRYRDKVFTYSFYRWGNWSGWSEDKITANDNREVQTATFYRYRDKVTSTVYYFRRWSDWSEFTDSEVTASDTVEVKTKKIYRYKIKTLA